MWSKSLAIDTHATSAIDPNDFTTTIDNPYMPLTPGTTFVYEDKQEHTIDYVVVTHTTKVIDGVTCVQVHDYELIDGQLSEDTLDWLAQDSQGNVWYFGENSHQFEPGNPDPVGHEGSWKAGVHGAEPGIVMEANPQVGDIYTEENAAPVANDQAEVLSLTEAANVTYGKFDNLLETHNFTPLDPSVSEHKFYASGVGNVLTTDNEGAFEQLVQILIDGGAGADALNGYVGRDTISGNRGDDTLSGLGGRDVIYGGSGNDTASGGARNDVLDGGNGNDTLSGEGGGDAVIGGFGNDRMSGGHGADQFVFAERDAGATDTITDYSQSDGDAIVTTDGLAGVAYDSHKGGFWHLVLNDGHTIVLDHVRDTDHNGHILDNVAILDALAA